MTPRRCVIMFVFACLGSVIAGSGPGEPGFTGSILTAGRLIPIGVLVLAALVVLTKADIKIIQFFRDYGPSKYDL